MMTQRKKYLGFILLIVVVAFSLNSCGFESSCYENKPENGEMTIKVSIDSPNDTVYVKIYQGVIENNKLLLVDTLTVASKVYEMPVNSYYSATADYIQDGKIVRAIDGDRISTRESEDEYGTICWNLKNISLDLRLKK